MLGLLVDEAELVQEAMRSASAVCFPEFELDVGYDKGAVHIEVFSDVLTESVFLLAGELGFPAAIVIVQKCVYFSQPVPLQEIADALLIKEKQLRNQGNGNAVVDEKYGVCPSVLLRGVAGAVKHRPECVTLA